MLAWLPVANAVVVVVLVVTVMRTNRSLIRTCRQLRVELLAHAVLCGQLVERSHGMIACDVCHGSIHVNDQLRTEWEPDGVSVLAHSGC